MSLDVLGQSVLSVILAGVNVFVGAVLGIGASVVTMLIQRASARSDASAAERRAIATDASQWALRLALCPVQTRESTLRSWTEQQAVILTRMQLQDPSGELARWYVRGVSPLIRLFNGPALNGSDWNAPSNRAQYISGVLTAWADRSVQPHQLTPELDRFPAL